MISNIKCRKVNCRKTKLQKCKDCEHKTKHNESGN